MMIRSSLASVLASPQCAVLVHTVHKGAQLGAVVGVVLAPPIFYARQEDDYYAQSFTFATSGIVLKSAMLGVGASLLLLYFKSRDQLDWSDLATRIHASAFQNHIDHFSVAGAAVGALVGAPTALIAVSDLGLSETSRMRVLRRAVRGAAVGCAIGVMASLFFFRR